MAKKARAKTAGSGRGSAARTPSRPDRAALSQVRVWQIQAVRDVLFVAAVLSLFWAGYALRAVTVPLLVALLLAYLFEPLIERMCQHPKINRVGAVSILLGAVLAGFLIVLALVVPLAVGQATKFIDDYREGTLGAKVATVTQYVPGVWRENVDSFLELIPGFTPHEAEPEDETGGDTTGSGQPGAGPRPGGARPADRRTAWSEEELRALYRDESARAAREQEPGLGGLTRSGIDAIVDAFTMVVRIGLLMFLIPFYFFFFSLWYEDVLRFARSLIPEKNRARTYDLVGKMDRVVSGFVRGRITISLIMGVMLAIGWYICGVPYAVALGLATGIFCIVPYLGGVGIPIAIGLLLFEHLNLPPEQRTIWLGSFGVFFWPLLVFALVQIIEGWVLVPAIAGRATNLDPVTILVVVLAGGSVLGFYGMLLAIPAAACGKILITDVLMPRIRAWTAGKARDPLPIDDQ